MVKPDSRAGRWLQVRGDHAADHGGADRAADGADVGVHAGGDAGLAGGHGCDDQVRHRRRRPGRSRGRGRAVATTICHGSSCATASSRRRPTAVSAGAGDELRLGAERAARGGRLSDAGDEHRDSMRQHQQPGLGDAGAEAVAGDVRGLQELRQERVHARTSPTPNSSATRLVVHTAGSRIIRMSISGLRRRAARRAPTAAQQHGGGDEQAEHPGGAPAPGGALAHGEQQRDQPAGQQQRGEPVDPARGTRSGDSGTRRGGDHGGQPRPRSSGSRTASGSRARSTIGPASTMPRPPPTARQRGQRADRGGDPCRAGTRRG